LTSVIIHKTWIIYMYNALEDSWFVHILLLTAILLIYKKHVGMY